MRIITAFLITLFDIGKVKKMNECRLKNVFRYYLFVLVSFLKKLIMKIEELLNSNRYSGGLGTQTVTLGVPRGTYLFNLYHMVKETNVISYCVKIVTTVCIYSFQNLHEYNTYWMYNYEFKSRQRQVNFLSNPNQNQ